VAFPRDVVHVEERPAGQAERVVDEAGDDVLVEHLARELVAEVLPRPRAVVVVVVVNPLEEVRDPPDAALGQGEADVRELAQHRRPHQVGSRVHDVEGRRRDQGGDGRVGRGDDLLRRRPDVQQEDDPLLRRRPPHRVPVVGVEARPAQLRGVLGEGHGVGALGRHPADLGGHDLGVPDGRDGARDEPARVGPAPRVDVPVVVRLHHRQGDVLVLRAGEQLAAELRERREAQRPEHAVGVHVLDPLVDVVAAGPDLGEGRRLEAVLLLGTPGDGVQGHVADRLAVVQPGVGAVVAGDELRGHVGVLGGEAPLEHVRRLDRVVVHAHEDQAVDVHWSPPWSRAPASGPGDVQRSGGKTLFTPPVGGGGGCVSLPPFGGPNAPTPAPGGADVSKFLTLLISGAASGGIFAIMASGIVLTYETTGIFNFGHGAVAFATAFLYWQLHSGGHWPIVPSAIVSILVFAPLLGLALDRMMLRRLSAAPVYARIVGTIGLFVALPNLALWILKQINARGGHLPTTTQVFTVPGLGPTPPDTWHLMKGLVLDSDQAAIFAAAAFSAIALWVLLRRTRLGLLMRADVDKRELAMLRGVNAPRNSAVTWVLTMMLAGLGGCLLGPLYGMNDVTYTLVVLGSLAAIVFAGLRSLPLAFIGGVLLGIVANMVAGYGDSFIPGFLLHLSGFRTAIPFILTIIGLIVLSLRKGRAAGSVAREAPQADYRRGMPQWRRALP